MPISPVARSEQPGTGGGSSVGLACVIYAPGVTEKRRLSTTPLYARAIGVLVGLIFILVGSTFAAVPLVADGWLRHLGGTDPGSCDGPTLTARSPGAARPVQLALPLPKAELHALAEVITMTRGTEGWDREARSVADQLRAMADHPFALPARRY
jgi:hypothetical protein